MDDKKDPAATFPPHIEETIREIIHEECARYDKGEGPKPVKRKGE